MVGATAAYNTTQNTISNVQVKGTTTVVGTTSVVIYTVPAGKKATIVLWKSNMRSLGANTQLNSQVNSFINRSVIAATLDTSLTDEKASGMLLVAGDVVQYVGNNAGNNGATDYLLTVQEVPA